MARHGFKRVVIVPSHGGNFNPISEVTEDLKQENPDNKVIAYTDFIGFIEHLTKVSQKHSITPEDSGAHAGESEVSMMMYTNPEGIRSDKIPEAKGYKGVFDKEATAKIFKNGIAALSPIGVLGDPAQITSERSEEYIDAIADAIIEFVKSQ